MPSANSFEDFEVWETEGSSFKMLQQSQVFENIWGCFCESRNGTWSENTMPCKNILGKMLKKLKKCRLIPWTRHGWSRSSEGNGLGLCLKIGYLTSANFLILQYTYIIYIYNIDTHIQIAYIRYMYMIHICMIYHFISPYYILYIWR